MDKAVRCFTCEQIDNLKSWSINQCLKLFFSMRQNRNITESTNQEISGVMFRINTEIFINWLKYNEDILIHHEDLAEECLRYNRLWYKMIEVVE